VSCMNIGCYKEAVHHLINALSNHAPTHKNISNNLWETLRRNFVFMDRLDLASFCDSRDLNNIIRSFDN
jgi:peroxin-5